jgi:putative flippase GtrA
MTRTGTLTQLLRYGVVGVASNLLLYVGYLGLGALGFGVKTAMTLVYAVGVTLTFVFNRKWSFGSKDALKSTFIKYVAAYAIGYGVNWLALFVLVDGLHFPHQIVQIVMIFCVAAMLFVLLKWWVFRGASESRWAGGYG